jgi:hypothetical protein
MAGTSRSARTAKQTSSFFIDVFLLNDLVYVDGLEPIEVQGS